MKELKLTVLLFLCVVCLICDTGCTPRKTHPALPSSNKTGQFLSNRSSPPFRISNKPGKLVATRAYEQYEIAVYEYEEEDSESEEIPIQTKNVTKNKGFGPRRDVQDSKASDKLSGVLPQIKDLIQGPFTIKHFGKSSEEYYDYYDDFNTNNGLVINNLASTNSKNSENGTQISSKQFSNDIGGRKNNDENICLTPECTLAAAQILRSVNTNVNPCKDFFKFSCGGWIKNNPIPPNKGSWNQVYLVEEKLDRQIKLILDSPTDPDDPTPLKQAKQFYRSCKLHVKTGDAKEHLKRLGDEYLNDFSDFVKDNKLATKIGSIRRELGGDFIVAIKVALDEKNTTNYIIYIDQPDFTLSRQALVSNSGNSVFHYKQLIETYWPIVYTGTNSTLASDIASEIVAFEILLANISSSSIQRANRINLYNPYTIDKFNMEFPETVEVMNLTEYIQEVFKDVVKNGHDFGNISKLRIIVRDPAYFKQLGQMLRYIEDNRSRVIENYLRWRIITEYGAAMSRKFRDVVYKFESVFGKLVQPASSNPLSVKTCADITNSHFGMAVSYKYVQQEFGVNFKSQIGDMVSNLMNSFEGILNETDWIATEETRAQALIKAKKMKPFLGYPDWLLNKTALNEHYKNLNFSNPNDVLANYLEVTRWLNKKALSNIGSFKDENRWVVDPSITNAFYYHTSNALIFPAGILKPPFYYSGDQIQALNYGSLGVVMGHEITHGFDYTGKDRDENGNLRNWWDDKTARNYLQKTQCFIKQYSNYDVEELSFGTKKIKLNGRDTLDENIADNGGLHQAFQAYKTYVKKNGVEKQLPGLKYTSEQLFFLSFAIYRDNHGMTMAFWALTYTLPKTLQLGDTVFIVLRKKKLILLHWYHHAAVMMLSWYAYQPYIPLLRFVGNMNYFTHSWMYSYYGLRALEIKLPKKISLLITVLELIQMVAGLLVTLFTIYQYNGERGCLISARAIATSCAIYSTLFVLFAKHFQTTAFKKRKTV